MLEKAKIKILEGPYADDPGEIEVMFNPTEYTDVKEVEKAGEGSNIQFKRVRMKTFSVKLFFDTYEEQGDKRDVKKKTEAIVSLLLPSVKGKSQRPPLCVYIWGSFSFRGIVSKVSQKFIMFLESGIPVRAELDVTFESVLIKEEEAKHESKTESRKFCMVKTGDRLDLIANKMLKDPTQWRKIAEENNITNPLAFPMANDIGRILIIPD